MGDIQAHLLEIYGTDISRETISKITDAIVEEMLAWQHRPLDRLYAFERGTRVLIRGGAADGGMEV